MCEKCNELENRFHEAWSSSASTKTYEQLRGQHEVAGYRLDFALPSLKIGIEIDSRQWHASNEAKRKDQERDDDLRKRGWKLLHLDGPDVYYQSNKMVDVVTFFIDNLFDQFVPPRKLMPVVENKNEMKRNDLLEKSALAALILSVILLPLFVVESVMNIQMIHSATDEKWGILFLFFYLTHPIWIHVIRRMSFSQKKGA